MEAVLKERLRFLKEELAMEKKSLRYIEKLTDARAIKGGDIVRLTIQQLQVEQRWLTELIADGRP